MPVRGNDARAPLAIQQQGDEEKREQDHLRVDAENDDLERESGHPFLGEPRLDALGESDASTEESARVAGTVSVTATRARLRQRALARTRHATTS